MRHPSDDFPLAQRWLDLCDWILGKTGRFPRHQRLLAERMASAALDGLEDLLAAYRRRGNEKTTAIEDAALRLERLRWLLRLARRQRLLSDESLAHATGLVEECRTQLSAWWTRAQRDAAQRD